ncbi:Rne/Rng family ribonuclease [Hoeflea sp. CAU 1731]
MADKMLIDASHEEETRVVVVRGNRIEEFDFESQHKKQLRGNIYLAKVTRVEPSLQAAFVDYGGNRHGFLAFSEIHPDYYQIPVADRQALLEAEARESMDDDDDQPEETEKPARRKSRSRRSRSKTAESAGKTAKSESSDDAVEATATDDGSSPEPAEDAVQASSEDVAAAAPQDDPSVDAPESQGAADNEDEDKNSPPETMAAAIDADQVSETVRREPGVDDEDDGDDDASEDDSDRSVELVGAEDALEEVPDRVRKSRKQYRIQEVIKRRQILLVQVVKEERGNKGAALTTYLSLAGRYSVLMPNTARGGGISRKITNVQDRKRLKEIARGLDVAQGMGVILRTAGANRTKSEIKRDFEYLMRLWENVRNLTLTSMAPCLVYEEGSLIKRSIRDLYNKDIGEVIVSGEEGYREAKDFMKMLMPSHAKAVQPYRDVQPIFARSGIEAQLDKMLQPQVTLKSGGYIIINQTEALVAIDVNSGRSTKEHSIEDTALRTNMEAAEEVARQLRLRDLAGLIVIDFIDMEEKRNNRSVEKKLKDCLKNDRARIQVGRISHFGLLEMSRQRIRASVLESTMQVCEHCAGTGYVRSLSSVALHVLRTAEEYLLRNTKYNITLRTLPETALYVLNQKRDTIRDLEARFGLSITLEADPSVGQQMVTIIQGEKVEDPVVVEDIVIPFVETEDDNVAVVESVDEEQDNGDSDGEGRKRKRRRRKRGGRGGGEQQEAATGDAASDEEPSTAEAVSDEQDGGEGDQKRKRRRRGKRGGRRNRDGEADGQENAAAADSDNPDATVADNAEEPVAAAPDAAEATVAPQPADDAAPAEEAKAEEQEAAPRKSRSRRKPRAKDAEEKPVVEDTPVVEPPSVAPNADEVASATAESETKSPEKPKRSRRKSVSVAEASNEPVLTSTAPGDAAETEEPKEKKVGWWQRRGFF